MSGITKEDLVDVDIVDATELASDATSIYDFKSVSAVSTAAGTQQVTVVGGSILADDLDKPIQDGDIVILTGTTAADGVYTFDVLVDNENFTVKEAIPNSTGGSCTFRHPSGAKKVGVDPTNLTGVATNLQEALEEIDANSGVTESEHRDLDTLVHILSGSQYIEVTRDPGTFLITNVKAYDDQSKTILVREMEVIYDEEFRARVSKCRQFDRSTGDLVEGMTSVIVYNSLFTPDEVHIADAWSESVFLDVNITV